MSRLLALLTLSQGLAGCGPAPRCDPGPGELHYSWQASLISVTEPFAESDGSARWGGDFGLFLGDDVYWLLDLDDALLALEGSDELVWPVRDPGQSGLTAAYINRDTENECIVTDENVSVTRFEIVDSVGEATVNPEETGGREFEIDDDYHRLYEITLSFHGNWLESCESPPEPFEITFQAELERDGVRGEPSSRCDVE